MSQQDAVHYASYEIFNGLAPKKGPRTLPLLLDFSIINPMSIDLALAQTQDKIEFAQSVYIDNSNNPNPITLVFAVSGQIITCPAGWQGYDQVLCPNNPRFTAQTTGTPIVPVQILTVPMPTGFYPASTGSTGQDFSANKPANLANLLATVPVNAKRQNIEVQNQSAAQIQVVLDDGSGANVSTVLLEANPAGANTGGGSWNNQSFKGRARIFGGAANQQVYVHQD